jgi:putative addiction module killer protein
MIGPIVSNERLPIRYDFVPDRLPATHVVARLEGGNRSGLKPVGEGASEWRIDWGPGIRIYLAFDGAKLIILLGGGTKSRQQADIARALQRWADYKQRKKTKE